MWMPLFDIFLLPHEAGGNREEVSLSSPSSGINPCSSLHFLLADNILGKRGRVERQGPGERLSQGVPSSPSLEVRVALRGESTKDMVAMATS